MTTELFFRPDVRVSIWKGHLYAGIWWCPLLPPLALLQPERLHTTLIRCWHPWRYGVEWPFIPLVRGWQHTMTQMLNQLLQHQRDARGAVSAWLRCPPWKKSWTFGVPIEVLPICEILQKMLAALCRSVSSEADVHEDEFHISWN